MGTCYRLSCGKCGYKFNAWLGSGMFSGFNITIDNSKNFFRDAKIDEDIQRFFDENPEGVIFGGSNYFGICVKCGNYQMVTSMTMYIPKEGCSLRAEDTAIFFGDKIKSIQKYVHKCNKCGGELEIFSESDLHNSGENSWKCPKCNTPMMLKWTGLWD